MLEYPSETVWILLNPDYSPINADYLGIASLKRKNRQKIVKPSKEDLANLVDRIDPMIEFTDRPWVHREKIGCTTCLAEVRGKIVCFING